VTSIEIPASPATPAPPATRSDTATGKPTGQPQAAGPAGEKPEDGGQLADRGGGENGRSKAGSGSASVTEVRTDGTGRRKDEGSGTESLADQIAPGGAGRSKRRTGQTTTSR
jgi:hypothetical protein